MKKVFYFLLTLVMCVSIMPSIASASSEAGSVCEEYDPKPAILPSQLTTTLRLCLRAAK